MSVNDIVNLNIHVEQDALYWDKNSMIRLPTLSQTPMLITVTLIFVVTVWILLLIIATRLNHAKNVGVRLEEDCGYEYLENESKRYNINKEYKKFKHYFKIISYLMIFPWLIIFVAAIYEAFLVYRVIGGEFEAPKKVNILYRLWVYMLYAFVMLASFVSVWIFQATVWESFAHAIKYDIPISKSIITKIRSSYISMATLLGFFIVSMLVLFVYANIQSRMLHYVLVAFVLTIVTAYLFTKIYQLHNNAIVPYNKKISEINETIKVNLEGSSGKVIERYLLANMRRSNPNDKTESLINNKSKEGTYYQYIMHKNGKESFTESGNSQTMPLENIKERLSRIYLNKIAISSFGSDITTIESTLSSGTTVSAYEFGDISFRVRFHMLNLLYSHVGINVPTLETLYSKLPYALRITKLNTNDVSNTLKLYKDLPSTVIPALEKQQSNVVTVEQVQSVLMQEYDTKNKERAADALLCVCLKATNFDKFTYVHLGGLSSAVVELQSTMSSYGTKNVYTILNMMRTNIDKLMEELPLRKLQKLMAEIRNLTPKVEGATTSFASTVIGVSAMMMVFLAFMLFHYMYKSAKGTFSVFIAAAVLAVFVVSAWYSWIVGNIK